MKFGLPMDPRPRRKWELPVDPSTEIVLAFVWKDAILFSGGGDGNLRKMQRS